MHVGERGRGHSRGEGRRVQFVVGVQDERDVERPGRQRGRPVPREHVEKVGGVAECRIRLDGSAARLEPAVGGDEAGQLTRQPNGFPEVGGQRVVRGLGIEVTEH